MRWLGAIWDQALRFLRGTTPGLYFESWRRRFRAPMWETRTEYHTVFEPPSAAGGSGDEILSAVRLQYRYELLRRCRGGQDALWYKHFLEASSQELLQSSPTCQTPPPAHGSGRSLSPSEMGAGEGAFYPTPPQTVPEDLSVSKNKLEYEAQLYNGLNVEGGSGSDTSSAKDSKESDHECAECGKTYSTSSNLARHRQTHRSMEDKKAKQCPHCYKTYVSLPAFSMHIRTHNQGCRCPYCGKCFSRPWLLQGHIRTHTGEKPFSCKLCNKSFADKSNLRAHVQTHSSVKPFQCGKCKKTFALKSYLYKHEESSCMKFEIKKLKEERRRQSRSQPVQESQLEILGAGPKQEPEPEVEVDVEAPQVEGEHDSGVEADQPHHPPYPVQDVEAIRRHEMLLQAIAAAASMRRCN